MGYPIAYRGVRSPQRARSRAVPNIPDFPPFEFGPLAGLAVASWSFAQLMRELDFGNLPGTGGQAYRLDPAAYGWTAVLNCAPNGTNKLPGFTACGTTVNGKASWEAPGWSALNPSVSVLYWWQPAARFNPALLRYEGCVRAVRWERGVSGANFNSAFAIQRPYRAPRPLPALWARALEILGMRDRGYGRYESVGVGWQAGRRTGTEPIVHEGFDVHDETVVRTWTTNVVQARAVPAAQTHEVKISQNTAAGRAFIAMYAAFNLLGDAYGFTRAIWKTIPKNRRGRSRRLGSMLRDFYDYTPDLARMSTFEKHQFFMRALANAGIWKLQDIAWGGVQAGVFNAQTQAYGANAARTWSTLDSAIRQSEGALQRATSRDQTSTRW